MLIASHKTRSILDRYDMVNEEDPQDAAERIAKGASATYSYSYGYNALRYSLTEAVDNAF
jgi:hypothetical protein